MDMYVTNQYSTGEKYGWEKREKKKETMDAFQAKSYRRQSQGAKCAYCIMHITWKPKNEDIKISAGFGGHTALNQTQWNTM